MSLPSIAPPATIGILGGGQLGRMLALAARSMGYRIAVMDPDPDCPTAALADRQVVAGYDDVGGALRLAAFSDVVTYELEHVAVAVVDALDGVVPVRPGRLPLLVTQDRIAERRFVEEAGANGRALARGPDDGRPAAGRRRARTAAAGQGHHRRVRRPEPDPRRGRRGYRWGARSGSAARLATSSWPRPKWPSTWRCRSSWPGAWTAVRRPYPLARNTHDAGILAESVAPAPVPAEVAERAADLGERLAVAMGMVGTLTAELFLMPDGELVVNELAPRVHNSGHWTIEGAATSQFEQHIRAICALPLGSTAALAPSAMVNLLGTGPQRAARLEVDEIGAALADPAVHLHLYDKRRVFERRKMGHLTAVGSSVEDALARARGAAAHVCWADDPVDGGKEGQR